MCVPIQAAARGRSHGDVVRTASRYGKERQKITRFQPRRHLAVHPSFTACVYATSMAVACLKNDVDATTPRRPATCVAHNCIQQVSHRPPGEVSGWWTPGRCRSRQTTTGRGKWRRFPRSAALAELPEISVVEPEKVARDGQSAPDDVGEARRG